MKNLLLLLTVNLLFAACSKCPSGAETLPPEILGPPGETGFFPNEKVPYLKYLKNSKDTITFYNLGIEQSFQKVSAQYDCETYINLERLRQVFYDSLNNDFFSLRLYKTNNPYTSYFSITINNQQMPNAHFGQFATAGPPPQS